MVTEALDARLDEENANPQPPQTGVVASPNQTADERQAKPNAAPSKVEGAPVQPAATTTGAPLKTTKSKSKHRKTKPSGD